jgi:hypothetical protein
MTISKPKAALALIFSPPVRTSTAGRALRVRLFGAWYMPRPCMCSRPTA